MLAMKTQACADLMDRSKSLASLGICLAMRRSVRRPIGAADLEAPGAVRPLDDFQREAPDLLQGAAQFRPCIAPISEDMAQPRPSLEDGPQDGWRAVAVLDIGGVDDRADQQAQRVDDDVALASP